MLDTFLPVVKEILVSSVSTSPPRMLLQLLLLLDNSLSLSLSFLLTETTMLDF